MKRPSQIGAALGLLALVAGVGLAPARTGAALLVLSWIFLGAGLTGALGIAVQYAHRGPDGDGLRAVCARLTRLLPYGAAGLLLALVCCPQLFSGYGLAAEGHGGFKALWLSRGFHLGRAVVILAIWLLSARALVAVARARQELANVPALETAAAGDAARVIARHGRLAARFFYVFGITVTIAAVDWLMALEPHWVSTILGLYTFAGLVLGGLGVLLLALLVGPRSELERRAATPARLHDLGQLVIAFSCLWVYLWFSQFLLIWYTGIPEESVPYISRLAGAWAPIFWLSLCLNFVIPFFVLLPREAKRSGAVLTKVAALLVAGRLVDLYVWIYPPAIGATPAIGWLEIGLALGALAAVEQALGGRRPAI